MAPQEIVVDAILFDMDGTLIDSTPVADLTYQQFVQRHTLENTGHLHGVRMVDSIRQWFPKAQQSEVTEMAIKFEMDLLENAKLLASQGKQGLVILPGVQNLLEQIRSNPKAENHYAICTSASRIFATTALSTAGITPPTHLLTADDCTFGKPDPEPYLKGAGLLSADIRSCLVIEDAPAGIRSGVAAGARVMAVCTSHERSQIDSFGASFVVDRLSEVAVKWNEDGRMVVSVGV